MKSIKDRQPIRTYSGEMWKTNTSNKVRLVKDFNNKCAYCDDHDKYIGGSNFYHVEHFAPSKKFPALKFTYDNLLYSCPYCNISKSNKWVGKYSYINVIGDEGFIDPCSDEYYIHLKRDSSGRITYVTKLGEYIYHELKLYLRRHEILHNLERIQNRIKLVKEKKKHKESINKDTTILNEVYRELCCTFYEYYELFTECDE